MKSKKLKNLISNPYFIVAAITILALFIRLLNLDKPFGLWYDEMLTYIFSSKPFPMGIIKALLREDFHMPLYYMYVHVWMKMFGSTDLILRFSSVLWGVLTIPAFFILGKTYKSEKVGYLLSIIGCLSPIMIFYSQELRFYSMLIFLATCSIIFFLRLIKEPNKKDFFWFYFSNLVILYIYTMGAVFVFIQLILLFINFYLYKKEHLKNLVKSSALFCVCSIPYLVLLISYIAASNNAIIAPLSQSSSNIYTPLAILNDLLSPMITGRYAQETSAYASFLSSVSGRIILIFLSTSSICLLIGFISSLRRFSRELLYLITIAVFFFTTEIVLYLAGSFVLMTRYAVIMLPIILLICVDGLLLIETNKLRVTCISLILLIFVYNSINYKNMPSFCNRPNGYKIPAEVLLKLNLSLDDYVIFPGRTELLQKYVNNCNFISFDIPGLLYLDKSKKEALKVFDKDFVYSTNQHNSLDKFAQYFLSTKPSAQLQQFMNLNIEKIPKGHRLILVDDWDNRINADLIPEFIKKYQQNKSPENVGIYRNMVFNFAYARIYKDLVTIIDGNKALKKVNHITVHGSGEKMKNWNINIYEKL